MTSPSTLLTVDIEYTNIHNTDECLVWVPELTILSLACMMFCWWGQILDVERHSRAASWSCAPYPVQRISQAHLTCMQMWFVKQLSNPSKASHLPHHLKKTCCSDVIPCTYLVISSLTWKKTDVVIRGPNDDVSRKSHTVIQELDMWQWMDKHAYARSISLYCEIQ